MAQKRLNQVSRKGCKRLRQTFLPLLGEGGRAEVAERAVGPFMVLRVRSCRHQHLGLLEGHEQLTNVGLVLKSAVETFAAAVLRRRSRCNKQPYDSVFLKKTFAPFLLQTQTRWLNEYGPVCRGA